MRNRRRLVAIAVIGVAVAGCGGSSRETPKTYNVGGTVAGLSGGAIVLQDNGGDDLTVAQDGRFTFPTQLAAGRPYEVTVRSAPAGLRCSTARASGVVGASDVTDVAVTCTPAGPSASTWAIGGAVSGLGADGLRVAIDIAGSAPAIVAAGATGYQLPAPVPSGAYHLSIASRPVGYVCGFDGGAAVRAVTVNGADVADANVTCEAIVLQRWAAPATWGATRTAFWDDSDPALVQHAFFDANGGAVDSKIGPWRFTGGTPPRPERLDAFPSGTRYGAGPFEQEGVNYQASAADAAALDRDGDMLACAVVRPDFDPVDDGRERPILSKGIANSTQPLPNGGWSLMQMHESFCFHYEALDATGATHSAMAATPLFQANQNASGLATSPPSTPDRDVAPLPSWVVVCGGRDGEQLRVAVNSADDALATESLAAFGPAPHRLDAATTQPATMGGYGGPLGIAGSSHLFRGRIYETAVWRVAATPANLQARLAAAQGLAAGARYTRNRAALTVGADGKLHMTWRHGPRIDATRGVLFGLQSWNRVNYWMDGAPPAPAPMVFAASENLSLWNRTSAAVTMARGAIPPPTGFGAPPYRVTLPPGEGLSIPLAQSLVNPNTGAPVTTEPPWYVPGAVHGQIWVLVPSDQPAAPGSVLRVRKDHWDDRANITGGVVRDRYEINLGSVPAGTWTRVWLNGTRGGLDTGGALSTDGTTAGTLYLENGGAAPITFLAWGLTITQVGGGGDLNSMSAVPVPFSVPSPDPGPFIYDPGAVNDAAGSFGPRYLEDVLQLARVPASTAASGFCLQVEAQPMDTMAWDVRIHRSRTPIAWANSVDPAQVSRILRLYVQGMDLPNPGMICFGSRALAKPGDWSTLQPETVVACGAIPSGWSPGSRHQLAACVTPAGDLSIYADAATRPAPIASGTLQDVPDLATGRVLVGNGVNGESSYSTPWHGYVSKALVCRPSNIAACE